jgi:hypothetical protein
MSFLQEETCMNFFVSSVCAAAAMAAAALATPASAAFSGDGDLLVPVSSGGWASRVEGRTRTYDWPAYSGYQGGYGYDYGPYPGYGQQGYAYDQGYGGPYDGGYDEDFY